MILLFIMTMMLCVTYTIRIGSTVLVCVRNIMLKYFCITGLMCYYSHVFLSFLSTSKLCYWYIIFQVVTFIMSYTGEPPLKKKQTGIASFFSKVPAQSEVFATPASQSDCPKETEVGVEVYYNYAMRCVDNQTLVLLNRLQRSHQEVT